MAKTSSKSVTGFRFLNAGEYVQGIPARDLTVKEAEKYGGVQRILGFSGVYEPIYGKAAAKKAKATEPKKE